MIPIFFYQKLINFSNKIIQFVFKMPKFSRSLICTPGQFSLLQQFELWVEYWEES